MPAILRIVLFISFASSALASNTITGSVPNPSRAQPAVGDQVILIRLDQGMHEEEHTRTNAQGTFSFEVLHPDKPYMVRVIHQNVNYDQKAPVGGTITVAVFDAAAYVPEISGTIEILRAGTLGKSLHVSDMFEIVNASSPPITQAGEHTFEAYLPANAKLDSVLAAGPEKIAVVVSAMPVAGEPGHYAVNFPLLPGATKFAFNYDLPYNGYATFRTWHAYRLQQLAVMLPTTMKFSSLSSKFQILRTGASNYQVRAVGQVLAGQGPSFTISGTGDFPPLQDQSSAQESAQSAAASGSPASGLNHVVPPSSARSSSGFRGSSFWPTALWVLGSSAFLASFTFIAWRACKVRANAIRGCGIRFAIRSQQSTTLLEGLKDELFQLETDRIRGAISREQYASARQALEQTVERAVAGTLNDSKRD
jgi:hypothetical protein